MEDLEDKVHLLDKQISSHEMVCAERYQGIRESFEKGSKRMQRMEIILYLITASILLGPGVVAEIVSKFIGK